MCMKDTVAATAATTLTEATVVTRTAPDADSGMAGPSWQAVAGGVVSGSAVVAEQGAL
jgi:hypothetical protein